MTEFGFRGTWSPDCYKPPLATNPRLSIDFATFGYPVLKESPSLDWHDNKSFEIQSARIFGNDILVLELDSITTDAAVDYRRLDTYQKVGNRLHAVRSQVFFASPKAQALGIRLGVAVDPSMPTSNDVGQVILMVPPIEQCQ